MPGKAAQTMPPTPQPALPLQLKPTGLKGKRETKGKEMMEVEKNHHPPQEDEAQRAAKQVKIGPKGVERKGETQDVPPAWLLAPMLNREPLLAISSIRDFQGGTAGYVADVVEQALLLLEDMAELQSMRRHEVFLSLKRYLGMVCFYLIHSIFLLYSFSKPFFFL